MARLEPQLEGCGYDRARMMLGLLVTEIVAAKRIDNAKDMSVLVDILANDLAGYPAELLEEAIRKHKTKSPFWPAITNLHDVLTNGMAHRQLVVSRLQELIIANDCIINEEGRRARHSNSNSTEQRAETARKAREAIRASCPPDFI